MRVLRPGHQFPQKSVYYLLMMTSFLRLALSAGIAVLKLEIGRRPTSKANDRWQCWGRVQR